MNTHRPFKHIAAAGLGAVLLTASAAALADPPARIARLAYVNGAVSLAPAGENNWEYATLNSTLIPGDRLWVEPGARDEVQVGGAALRMGGGTLVSLLNLDDRTTQLQLSQGRLNVRVRHLRPNDVFEIDTPNLALTIRQPGDYRIDVDPSGNATMVSVRSGLAEAYGDGNAYRITSGQSVSFDGTDLRDARYVRVAPDEFDSWSAARDRRYAQARSARYVSPGLIGYEDLDEQGTWRVVPNYGNVWMPANVGRDWAPYRNGHWSYVQPWGWTWVDDAPWGFAVSHYGRWARLPDGWGWVPGPRAATPLYAPALVAFVNFGGSGYAPRERPVAWFPLAPREVYRPSYRASPTYITNINITNTTIERGQIGRDDRGATYANRRVGGAVTAIPATAFTRNQPVSRAVLAVPAAALAAAAVAHAAPVAPERGAGRERAGRQPPPALMARQVLARNAPRETTRGAPSPAAQAPMAALPPTRVLPQDRHGAGRQLRAVPAGPAPAAGPALAPEIRAAQSMQAARGNGPAVGEQPERGRFAGPGDQRPHRGQRDAAPLPGQAGVFPAPGMPAAAAAREHGRDRVPPLAHAPTPVEAQAAAPQRDPRQGEGRQCREQQQAIQQRVADDQRAAAEQQRDREQAEGRQRRGQQQAMQQQRAADDQQRAAAEQQRDRQQAEGRQRREQQAAQQQQQRAAEDQQRAQQRAAAEQQRNQQHAAQQQQQQQQQRAAEEQQRHQQQAVQQQQRAAEEQQRAQQAAQQREQRAQQQAAAEQRRNERQQRREAPPAPAQAAPAQPAPPPQDGHGKKEEKEERRHGGRPDRG